MRIINDMFNFINTLSFIDIIFFFAVVALMLLIITLIYFIKEDEEDATLCQNTNNILDLDYKIKEVDNLKEITEALESVDSNIVNMSKYEEEQEEKAIISYEELLNKKRNYALNYCEEENIGDDLTIKKIDLDNLVIKDDLVRKYSNSDDGLYNKEEAFLENLKSLQKTLN